MAANKKRIAKATMWRLIKYIYFISPKCFWLSLIFTVLMGFTSTLSIWSLKILINFISRVSSTGSGDFLKVLTIYGGANILVMVIRAVNTLVASKHRMIVDYKTGIDTLSKCSSLTLKDFESSESYNIIARGEGEGRGRIFSFMFLNT